ncbi:MAG: N-acetyl-gamma-glutamyl-phosphate reductase, partial [Solirubrobacteraceae bacterium]|nr:N-acetyl-gamma-glutamyl-phosphate reductase [Solirubrobacteraceae bacterium]
MRKTVGVIGASGYAGALAAQLINRHPFFELAYVTARAEAGQRLGDLHPRTRVDLVLEAFNPEIAVDAAIVGYPHGAAAPTVAALRERGVRVIDLSADFR